jgi:RNA recognition motif-containing protein
MAAADVGNLSWDVDKEGLADHFAQFGEVRFDTICITVVLPPLLPLSLSYFRLRILLSSWTVRPKGAVALAL